MTDLVPIDTTGYDVASMKYDELEAYSAGSAFTLPGASLVPKEHLVGVPHIITAVTFQSIPEPTKAVPDPRGYVSIEATVASESKLAREVARGRIIMDGTVVSSLDNVLVDPDERIVYNDGSTGIRRQIVEMFHAFGLIRVAEDIDPRVSREPFDQAWPKWESYPKPLVRGESEALRFETNHRGAALAIVVARGLRISQYDAGYGEPSVTFYLS